MKSSTKTPEKSLTKSLIKHLKKTYKNECIEFGLFHNKGVFNISIISNYTKKIIPWDIFLCSKMCESGKLIIPNSVQLIECNDYNKRGNKCIKIQPTNILKIKGNNLNKMQYDYSFSKHKLTYNILNVILQHTFTFFFEKNNIKNIFLVEHIVKLIYMCAFIYKNKCSHIIIFKNVKDIKLHCIKLNIFHMISILKNTYCLFFNFHCATEKYVFILNNLCNVFKLSVDRCFDIASTRKTIKNYKLILNGGHSIFNENEFNFSCVANLTIDMCTMIYKQNLQNVLNNLKMINTVRILQIKYYKQGKYITKSIFKHVELLKIEYIYDGEGI